MSTIKNLLNRLSLIPTPKDVTFDELERILTHFGFSKRNGDGSHRVFTHPKTRIRPTIPQKNPVKAVYVRTAIQAINEVRELDL